MNRCSRLLLAGMAAASLTAATPGLSVSLAQGVSNSDQPFGLGGGVGFSLLFREKENTQGRLRLEYFSLGKGTGATRPYTDYGTYPPQSRSYSTACRGDLAQVAYDWRIPMGDGGSRVILGVGYFQLHASLQSAPVDGYQGWHFDSDTEWQRQGATGTFGFGWALGPKVDLELRYNHYQAILLFFPVEGEVNLRPSNLALSLQIRF